MLPCSQSEDGEAMIGNFADSKDAYHYWIRAMYNYSLRKLTYDTDRLPAVTALASIVARKTGDLYLAGLWRGDLLRQLMWNPCRPGVLFQFADDPNDLYVAPSWSWAARRHPAGAWNASTKYALHGEYKAEIIEAECRPDSNNAFGTVQSGHLVLRGVCNFTNLSISGGNLMRKCRASLTLFGSTFIVDSSSDGHYSDYRLVTSEIDVTAGASVLRPTMPSHCQPLQRDWPSLCLLPHRDLLPHLSSFKAGTRGFRAPGLDFLRIERQGP